MKASVVVAGPCAGMSPSGPPEEAIRKEPARLGRPGAGVFAASSCLIGSRSGAASGRRTRRPTHLDHMSIRGGMMAGLVGGVIAAGAMRTLP
jgi:hypothetical protein